MTDAPKLNGVPLAVEFVAFPTMSTRVDVSELNEAMASTGMWIAVLSSVGPDPAGIEGFRWKRDVHALGHNAQESLDNLTQKPEWKALVHH